MLDVDDFERWYRGEHPRLLASLTLVAGDADLAGEAVDEALARALERWGRVGAMGSPGGWVYTVALHQLRRRQRRRALERRLLRRQPVPAGVPPPAGEAWDAVRRLPERQRTAVVLRYVADLPEAEIAAAMGIARSTVSSTLTSAHRALALALSDPPLPEVP